MFTTLAEAARRGDSATVKTLLERQKTTPLWSLLGLWDYYMNPIEAYDQYGQTPLMAAANNGHLEVARLLLQAGATVDACNARAYWGGAALHYAAQSGHTRIVQLLLQYGADINRINTQRCTPLCLAAAGGHLDTVRTLLANEGLNTLECGDLHGRTPLLAAAYYRHVETMRLLLENGANRTGALLTAVEGSCFTENRALKVQQILALILEKGGDTPQIQQEIGRALHVIAQDGNAEALLSLLLPLCTDIDVPDADGRSPLQYAAHHYTTDPCPCCRDQDYDQHWTPSFLNKQYAEFYKDPTPHPLKQLLANGAEPRDTPHPMFQKYIDYYVASRAAILKGNPGDPVLVNQLLPMVVIGKCIPSLANNLLTCMLLQPKHPLQPLAKTALSRLTPTQKACVYSVLQVAADHHLRDPAELAQMLGDIYGSSIPTEGSAQAFKRAYHALNHPSKETVPHHTPVLIDRAPSSGELVATFLSSLTTTDISVQYHDRL